MTTPERYGATKSVFLKRIIDLEENFWTMGDTGPCGPCTEFFMTMVQTLRVDHPARQKRWRPVIEFWNLVFPQFDRSADGELALASGWC